MYRRQSVEELLPMIFYGFRIQINGNHMKKTKEMQAQHWYLMKDFSLLFGNSFAKFIRLSSLSTKLYSNALFNREKELVNRRGSIFSRCVLLIPSCVSLIFSNVLFNTETELVKKMHFFSTDVSFTVCFFLDLLLIPNKCQGTNLINNKVCF